MPKKGVAFLSYSSRYAAWVEVLQRNLEQCLRAAGEDRPVFLDRLDLGVGIADFCASRFCRVDDAGEGKLPPSDDFMATLPVRGLQKPADVKGLGALS